MNKVRLGCWIDLPSPQVAEIVAGTGFDYGVIDLEHGAINVETASLMMLALQANGVKAIARLPDQSEAWIKRMLDAGADGLIVPRVESASEAKAIIAHARYAPLGQRGEGLPVARASAYGRKSPAYRAQWQSEPYLAMQIESDAGYKAVEEIAAVKGVTQLFFGPSDYSASLNVDIGDAAVLAAEKGVAEVAAAHGQTAGSIVLGAGQVTRLARSGYADIAVAADIINLVAALDGALAQAKQDVADAAK